MYFDENHSVVRFWWRLNYVKHPPFEIRSLGNLLARKIYYFTSYLYISVISNCSRSQGWKAKACIDCAKLRATDLYGTWLSFYHNWPVTWKLLNGNNHLPKSLEQYFSCSLSDKLHRGQRVAEKRIDKYMYFQILFFLLSLASHAKTCLFLVYWATSEQYFHLHPRLCLFACWIIKDWLRQKINLNSISANFLKMEKTANETL